jgi:hypothetical protein
MNMNRSTRSAQRGSSEYAAATIYRAFKPRHFRRRRNYPNLRGLRVLLFKFFSHQP